VALVHGDDRRKNVYNALMAVDDQIRPRLKRKRYAMTKPNNVSNVKQLAATHVDALRGILDYLRDRLRGPVVVAESGPRDTMEGFENFGYPRLVSEYRAQ
jgi:uncharacterized protein (DUF362 family)